MTEDKGLRARITDAVVAETLRTLIDTVEGLLAEGLTKEQLDAATRVLSECSWAAYYESKGGDAVSHRPIERALAHVQRLSNEEG